MIWLLLLGIFLGFVLGYIVGNWRGVTKGEKNGKLKALIAIKRDPNLELRKKND